MKSTLLLWLTFVSCAVAQAIPIEKPDMNTSGNRFLSICGDALDAQHIMPVGATCLTYVIGLHDGIGMFADKGGPAELYCQPDGVTAGQTLRILVKIHKGPS